MAKGLTRKGPWLEGRGAVEGRKGCEVGGADGGPVDREGSTRRILKSIFFGDL